MSTIQLEISDTLAQKLVPYHNELPQLLELGLQMWAKHEEKEAKKNQEYLHQLLASSGKVRVPTPYPIGQSFSRQTPVPITGESVSQLVIEQRESS